MKIGQEAHALLERWVRISLARRGGQVTVTVEMDGATTSRSSPDLPSPPGLQVSVIVPHYNDLNGLDICLNALAAQTLRRDAYEVIVGDNGSPQGSDAVEALIAGRARLIIVPERGAGPARNGAADLARAPVLAFIDSDCVAEPAWLAEGLAALSAWDFVGGQVKVLAENPDNPTPTEAFETVFAFDFKTYITRKGFTGSGNLFCPRALFRSVGGFRVGVSEDVDWSRRATAAGYRLGYAPKAVVGHPGRRTWPELRAKFARVNAETYGLMQERRLARLAWLVRTVAVAASPIAHAPKVMFTDRLHGPRQRFDALAILIRIRLWRAWDGLRLLGAGSPGL